MQALVKKVGPQLNTRCEKVEKATQELLAVLLPEGMSLEDMAAAMETKSGTTTPSRMTSRLSVLEEEEEELKPGELTEQRKARKRQELYQEAEYLLSYCNKKTMEALIRCTRTTLESIKRRVTSPSALSYSEDDRNRNKKVDLRPAFKVKLVLSIPQVSLRPSIEEIQTTVNAVVQSVLSTHKEVLQWGQVPTSPLTDPSKAQLTSQSKVLTPTNLAQGSKVLGNASAVFEKKQDAPRTFFKLISEHKEIAKLVSVLSSTISSAKGLVAQSLEQFKVYEHLWTLDRDEHMKTFLESNPGLSEFESEIKRYMQLEETITEEEEEITVGSLSLVTGEL